MQSYENRKYFVISVTPVLQVRRTAQHPLQLHRDTSSYIFQLQVRICLDKTFDKRLQEKTFVSLSNDYITIIYLI